MRPRFARPRVLGVITALALVPAVLLVPTAPASAGPADFSCLGANGLGYSQGNTPTNLLAGRLTIPGFAVTNIGTGDINFVGLNKGKNPTWQLWFNSLKWLEPLVDAYAAGQSNGSASMNRALAIAKDFAGTYKEHTPAGTDPAWNDQATSLRTETLACMAKYSSDPTLIAALDTHARHLADSRNYSGDWNHGLEQTIGLLAAGCVRDNASYIGTAESRAHGALLNSIDAQGSFNEQAPGYGPWTITRWWTVDQELQTCGRPPLPDLDARLHGLARFLANATQPDGRFVQLGDTYREGARSDVANAYPELKWATSMGAAGQAPPSTLSIYKSGYVFSRTGWGTQHPFISEGFFSLHYGPMRFTHGHWDHESVTWFARGRPLLVDSGHVGYEVSAYHNWIRSPEAHNVLTVPGVPFRTYSASTLTKWKADSKGQFFEVTDHNRTSGGGYQGLSRTRGVFLAPKSQFMVVFDRVSTAKLRWMYVKKAKTRVRWWHLDPAFRARTVTPSRVEAVAGTTKLSVLQVPFPGETLARGSQKVVRGATRPYQGWVSQTTRKRLPAVAIGQYSTKARTVSIIVPSTVHSSVKARIVKRARGWYQIDIWIGSSHQVVRITPDLRLVR